MSGKPMQHSSSYTRLAGMVPETILQNRQSGEVRVELGFIFMISTVESTSDAGPLSMGCKRRQRPRDWRSRGGSMSRSRRRDAASDHPAKSRQVAETHAVSWFADRRRYRE